MNLANTVIKIIKFIIYFFILESCPSYNFYTKRNSFRKWGMSSDNMVFKLLPNSLRLNFDTVFKNPLFFICGRRRFNQDFNF